MDLKLIRTGLTCSNSGFTFRFCLECSLLIPPGSDVQEDQGLIFRLLILKAFRFAASPGRWFHCTNTFIFSVIRNEKGCFYFPLLNIPSHPRALILFDFPSCKKRKKHEPLYKLPPLLLNPQAWCISPLEGDFSYLRQSQAAAGAHCCAVYKPLSQPL